MFDAVMIEKSADGTQTVRIESVDDARLPDGDVTVRVEWSTLNYKDALAITGRGPIVRQFPMVPGIDFAGVVESSARADMPRGTRVVLNGWGVGERWWGGLAGRARVDAWRRLAELTDPARLESMVSEITLAEVPQTAAALLDGGVRGRVVVRVT